MCAFLKSSGRLLLAGWFWPLALLMLPNCIFQHYELDKEEFDPGGESRSGAIMCDIPVVPPPGEDDCANDSDEASGMSSARAAVALAQGELGVAVALDFSTEATGACAGKPKKTRFHGPFPNGLPVCLNCGQIPAVYTDANAACVAKCIDLTEQGLFQPPDGAQSFCEAKARVSTNFKKDECYEGACSLGGTPLLVGFADPRRQPEPVAWTDVLGDAVATDNDLSKGDDSDMDPMNWDSGAVSDKKIERGDAWIEFEAKESNRSHVLGVSTHSGLMDANPDITDTDVALSLNLDGSVYILQKGDVVSGPLTTYAAGDRFRIHIADNNDGTATITYWRLDGACTPGTKCAEIPLDPNTAQTATYPLRVNASFREGKANLSNVTMVYIHQQQ